jgi:hypothetical protein
LSCGLIAARVASAPGPWKDFTIREVVDEGGVELPVEERVGAKVPTIRLGEPIVDGSCVEAGFVAAEEAQPPPSWPEGQPFEEIFVVGRMGPECTARFAGW